MFVLESDGSVALEALARKVSRGSLELVRAVKGRLNRLLDRATKQREEAGVCRLLSPKGYAADP